MLLFLATFFLFLFLFLFFQQIKFTTIVATDQHLSSLGGGAYTSQGFICSWKICLSFLSLSDFMKMVSLIYWNELSESCRLWHLQVSGVIASPGLFGDDASSINQLVLAAVGTVARPPSICLISWYFVLVACEACTVTTQWSKYESTPHRCCWLHSTRATSESISMQTRTINPIRGSTTNATHPNADAAAMA